MVFIWSEYYFTKDFVDRELKNLWKLWVQKYWKLWRLLRCRLGRLMRSFYAGAHRTAGKSLIDWWIFSEGEAWELKLCYIIGDTMKTRIQALCATSWNWVCWFGSSEYRLLGITEDSEEGKALTAERDGKSRRSTSSRDDGRNKMDPLCLFCMDICFGLKSAL